MTFLDSLTVALFGLAVVFVMLTLLSLLVKIQSLVLGYIGSSGHKPDISAAAGISAEITAADDEGWSAGELKLLGVDERTAAMIMAIVSDESQIPLSELRFKMIKAID